MKKYLMKLKKGWFQKISLQPFFKAIVLPVSTIQKLK